MENNFEKELIQELQSEGVLKEEAEELLEVIHKASQVAKTDRSYLSKMAFLEKIETLSRKDSKRMFAFSPRFLAPALAFVILLFILVTEVVNAQKSLPGQPLYGLKRLSENIAKTVDPSFKSEVVIRRSEEIKSLTEEKKDGNLLKKTVNDYKNALRNNTNINQDSIEESQKNLEEAKNQSAGSGKKEIESAIISTQDQIKSRDENNVEGKKTKNIAPTQSGNNPDSRQNKGENNGEGKSKEGVNKS